MEIRRYTTWNIPQPTASPDQHQQWARTASRLRQHIFAAVAACRRRRAQSSCGGIMITNQAAETGFKSSLCEEAIRCHFRRNEHSFTVVASVASARQSVTNVLVTANCSWPNYDRRCYYDRGFTLSPSGLTELKRRSRPSSLLLRPLLYDEGGYAFAQFVRQSAYRHPVSSRDQSNSYVFPWPPVVPAVVVIVVICGLLLFWIAVTMASITRSLLANIES